MARLKVGDRVLCRLFNTPENKFYGDFWIGTIKEITIGYSKKYLVTREGMPEGVADIRLQRKEIKRRLKEET